MKYLLFTLSILTLISCSDLKKLNNELKIIVVEDKADTVLTLDYLCNGCIENTPVTSYDLFVKKRITYFKKMGVNSEATNIGHIFDFYIKNKLDIDSCELVKPNIQLSHYYFVNATLRINNEIVWNKKIPDYFRESNFDEKLVVWLRLIESSIFLKGNR